MGAIARALNSLGGLIPERKVNVGATVPNWEVGNPQNPRYWHNYYRFALEGYSRNEIVYACIEELATSAAEPRLCVVRKTAKGPEQIHDHPLLDLLDNPNPFMSRFQLIASLIMYRAIAGNGYLSLTRSAAGKVVQLWPLRPDRVFAIPDRQRYIGGWEYRLDDMRFRLPAEDIIQTRTRNPLDDFYGLPPLAVCAERVDTDTMLRSFTLAFFRNAAVPAGLLTITKQVAAAERQVIRDRLRGESGGPQNWHQMMILDGTEAKFTPMGMPLGQSGIVLPELDEISESRIAMAFGVPLELVGARLGMVHGNRSTTLAARGSFWDETLAPLYQELAADFTRGFYREYEGTSDEFDYVEFDLSTVKALQEDEDAKHKRIRDDLLAGIISVQEARTALGRDPDYEEDALLILASHVEPMTARQAMEGGPPFPPQGALPGQVPAPPAGQQPPAPNGNGKRPSAGDLAALAALAKGQE
jgi:HK97 family phage portal protein